jgi:Ser/Thr protein kinase RdoA (MazF antagonist)
VTVPPAVVAAFGWDAAEIVAIPGGLINETYAVQVAAAPPRVSEAIGGVPTTPIAVLQRVHPIFGAAVNLDIDAVTTHLAARGMITPRIVPALDGRRFVEEAPGGRSWRALSWVAGTTVHAVPSLAWAEAGGELVGRFHRAVADLRHDYLFARAGVHDTAAHLARLEERHARERELRDGSELAAEILAAASELPAMPVTPRRHCHGDLKISNLMFAEDPVRGVCLVDLDTVGLGTIAFELGDAMRSWCNPRGEDAGSVAFDLPIFAAAIRGFRSVADAIISDDERASIVVGLETVCIELAARFAVDYFDDTYFGWDPARFPSRRAHNLVRARGQLALGLAVRAARADALDVVRG